MKTCFIFLVLILSSIILAQPIWRLDFETIKTDAQGQFERANQKVEEGSASAEVYAIAIMSAMYLEKFDTALSLINKLENSPEGKQNEAGTKALKSMAYSLIAKTKKGQEKEYFSKAAEFAREAAIKEPKNLVYASYWEAYSKLAGQEAMHSIALRHIESIDPEKTKEIPVMDPVTGTVIIVAIVCTTWSYMYTISNDSQRELMIQTFPDLANVFLAGLPSDIKNFVPQEY